MRHKESDWLRERRRFPADSRARMGLWGLCFGDCDFSITGLRLWNAVPGSITDCKSIGTLKNSLMAHLKSSFPKRVRALYKHGLVMPMPSSETMLWKSAFHLLHICLYLCIFMKCGAGRSTGGGALGCKGLDPPAWPIGPA